MTGNIRGKKPDQGEEAAGVPDRRPTVLMAVLLALLVVSIVYPAQAWPLHGFLTGAGMIALLAVAILPGKTRVPSLDIHGGVALLALVLWGLFRGLGGWLAPYLPPATGPAVTALLLAIVYTLGLLLARRDGHGVTRLVAITLLAVTTLMSLHAFWQVYGPAGMPGTFRSMEQSILRDVAESDPMREGLLHAVREGRASSTLGAPNIFGSFCVVGLLLSISGVAFFRGAGRVVSIGALALCAGALLLSGSRGGVVATLVGTGFLASLLAAWRWGGTRVYQVVTLLLGGATVALVVALIILFSLDTASSRWMGSSGLGQRMYYWQTAFAAWGEAPWIGHGTGSYGTIYLEYRQPGSNETRHSHSWFFDFMAESGLFGTLLFLTFLVVVGIRTVILLYRQATTHSIPPTVFALQAALLSSGIAILIHGLAEYTLSFRESALVGFLALGVVSGALVSPNWRVIRPDVERGVLLFLALLLMVTGAIWLRTEARIQSAAEMRKTAAMIWGDPGLRTEAMELINNAVRSAPEDGANWETRGIFREMVRDGRALSDFEEAAARNPQSARLQERLSIYHETRGNRDLALLHQRLAVKLHPLDVAHRLRLAKLLLEKGNKQEAISHWLVTDGLHVPSIQVGRERERMGELLGVGVMPLNALPLQEP